MPVDQKQIELIHALADEAWSLPEEYLDAIRPGAAGIQDAIDLLTFPDPPDRPLAPRTEFDLDNPHVHLLSLLRQPEFFPYTCRTLFNRPDGSGPLHILPFQHIALTELWWRQFPMLIATRGAGKSFLLALYSLLRALFTPGAKVIITGASFRQSKAVFEYIERLWYNSPVFQNLVNSGQRARKRDNGPRRDIDRVEFILGDSVIVGLPLGNGEKIRGLRGNYILADEMACLAPDTLVETDRGLMRIKDAGAEMGRFALLQPGGGEVVPDGFIRTPPTEAYKVVTEGGYEFTCSAIHKVMTTTGWKLGKDLTEDDYLIHENEYRFPDQQVEDVESGVVVDEEVAWLFGALLSEGAIADRHTVQVKATSELFVRRVQGILQKLAPGYSVPLRTRAAYTDARGWDCKETFETYCNSLALRDAFERLGLDRVTAIDKKLPWAILRSPRRVVEAFLSGLFDGDGTACHWKSHGVPGHLGIAYYTASEQLAKELHVLLSKFDVFGSRCTRASNLSDREQWMIRMTGPNAHRLASLLDVPRFEEVVRTAVTPHQLPHKGVVWDKSRGKWKAEVRINRKIKYLGGYVDKNDAIAVVEKNSPPEHLRVRSVERLSGEHVLYDFHVPDTHRFFGNGFVQHNSIKEEVYAVVVQGFGAVTADPVGNVRDSARQRLLKRLALWTGEMDAEEAKKLRGNQSVLSGTCDYAFNHFCRYWREYKQTVETRGDPEAIRRLFHGADPPEGFNWQAYSVIRLPYNLVPHGYMDASTIARARQITNTGQFKREYLTVFESDSDGFFKRSLIERCVVGSPLYQPVAFPSCGPVEFTASLTGNPDCKYVYGIDPASESDNFAVAVMEMWPEHRRLVYAWTTQKSEHRRRLKQNKAATEHDFYRYAVRKVRDLMKVFPPALIMVDHGGGGVPLREALGDPDKLEPGELPIYEEIDPEGKEKKLTDDFEGLHILRLIKFRDQAWVVEANETLKKDMEDRVLLFPLLDSLALGLAQAADEAAGRRGVDDNGDPVLPTADTLEQAMLDIEETKNELTTIVVTETATGNRRWDTPDTKAEGAKAGRMRKDRYSALLMANMGARQLMRAPAEPEKVSVFGGFARDFAGRIKPKNAPAEMYTGPGWMRRKWKETGGYGGAAVRRR